MVYQSSIIVRGCAGLKNSRVKSKQYKLQKKAKITGTNNS